MSAQYCTDAVISPRYLALQLTETYEYTQALGNSQFSLPGLQPFKLVYASWLADLGMHAEALEYARISLLRPGFCHEIMRGGGDCVLSLTTLREPSLIARFLHHADTATWSWPA